MNSKEIILVVDDNVDLIDGVKTTLEMEGFQVLTAENGAEALTVLERITPDLILADIMMPQMDGYQLYDKVHSDDRWVHVPFIFLTAKSDKYDVRRGKEMGVDDYVTKPFESGDILAAIRGRLKRMTEFSDRPVSTDAVGNIRSAWKGSLGPIPVPVITLIGAAILLALILFPLTVWGPVNAVELGLVERPIREGTSDMVSVPAGEFIMGGEGSNALAETTIDLPAFQIDQYEVTNAAYQLFVADTGSDGPWKEYEEARANYPVTGVTWHDAQAYCQWAGKRLPSEAEWEKAARGTSGQAYPWGEEWMAGHANTKEANTTGTSEVGQYADGVSPYQALDMSGNVWEWVDDWSDNQNTNKVFRGGAWNAINTWGTTYARNMSPPGASQVNLGFRCAR